MTTQYFPTLNSMRAAIEKLGLVQAFYAGKPIENYYLDPDGVFYSVKETLKKGYRLKILRWTAARKKAANGTWRASYPRTTMYLNRRDTRRNCVMAHKMIAETLVPPPDRYPGIKKKHWRETPVPVQRMLLSTLYVNHIDHDPTNFHPSNLEFVTPRENSIAARDHYRKAL